MRVVPIFSSDPAKKAVGVLHQDLSFCFRKFPTAKITTKQVFVVCSVLFSNVLYLKTFLDIINIYIFWIFLLPELVDGKCLQQYKRNLNVVV